MNSTALTKTTVCDIKTITHVAFRISNMYPRVADQVNPEIVRHRILRDRLVAEIPDIDAETLADTLEGITELREILAELVRSALEDEALSAGLATRLAEMKARAQRLENRAEKKRALALRAMTEAEIQTVIEPDFTASLRRGAPALEVVAEERIPDDYWKPQPPKLDRQALLAALKGGSEIEGVTLGAPQVQLSVRTK
jgi:Siphovirus Gp157